MVNPQVEATKNSSKEKILLIVTLLVLGVGITGYYFFYNEAVYKFSSLIGSIIIALVVFFGVTNSGKALISFGQETKKELYKVFWPTRKEATSMTLYVVVLVVVVSIFLWLVDKILEWGVFSLILGWR